MISALKKLAKKNEDAKSRAAMPSGVTSMGQSLQRKFGRGVQYNSTYESLQQLHIYGYLKLLWNFCLALKFPMN